MKPLRRTSRRRKQIGISKKEPCHCGSGKPYNLCHFGSDHETTLHTGINCKACGTEITKDISNDILIRISNGMIKWHNYFKSNGLFKFNTITLGHLLKLEDLESKQKELKKEDLYDIYFDSLTKEKAISHINLSCKFTEFENRKQIILDAIDAHFNQKYTLSIPALFPLIEGIIRDIQKIPKEKQFQCKFSKEDFSNKGLFMIADDLDYFNAFINKLYEGQANSTEFNRNPVLHGFSLNYYSKEHSIILILALFEIATILRWIRDEKQEILDLF
ncbi:hypothetical protein [Leptospira soteropolitanensis]|nr:hypothetical protein [Leptospira soteropolitanensis]MCW7494835.1 hypothetical protein [Leptospira soteropolitanensis]MCW7502413.1 hypothetical protein [Leptospira soteropolitanensis]MCW7524656.1 hypothetical protein [Leptospira soteropolitanensis]MCW7532386.1 hypothetical protein [Leptospira soteropolitanensis]